MSISIVIPTLNSEKYLLKCLSSIKKQKYNKKIEIIIVDGGSKDKTLKIAKKFRCQTLKNKLVTGEAGKMEGLKNSKYKYVLFLDSDNEIPDNKWLKNLTEPLKKKEIVSAEPVRFCYNKKFGHIDRYCSLIGMNDPINYFIGNYDKYSLLNKKWTKLKIKQEAKNKYFKVLINQTSKKLTYGANGTIYKKNVLRKFENKKYFFDVDILSDLINNKKRYFAKTKQCIIHHYCEDSYFKFFLKQKRRINDFLKFYKQRRKNTEKKSYFFFILNCLLIFPIIYQTTKIFYRSKDFASLNHIILIYITLFTYGYISIKKYLKTFF